MYNKLITKGIYPRVKVFYMFLRKYLSKTNAQKKQEEKKEKK